MAQTPLSALTPYATVDDLFTFHTWTQIADCLRDDNQERPTVAVMKNVNTPEGAMLYNHLLGASGMVESVCLIGNRYTPTDLQALDGGSKWLLKKLVSDLANWSVTQRKQPATADPRNVPGALQAFDMLKSLRDGEQIFGTVESGNAGLVSTQQANPSRLITPNVVGRAVRLFPTYGQNTLNGGNFEG